MSSYSINNSSQTVSNMTVTIIATAIFMSSPALPAPKPSRINLKSTSYSMSTTPSTFDQQTNFLTGEIVQYSDPVADAVTNIYAHLLNNQERLEPVLEQILHDNLWDLYES